MESSPDFTDGGEEQNSCGSSSNASFETESMGSLSPMRNRIHMDFWADDKEEKEVLVSDLKHGRSAKETMKVRISFSSETFQSLKGVKYHRFHGIGRDGFEISFVSFGQVAVQLKEKVKENSVFFITNFQVNKSDSRYERCGNQLEVCLDSGTTIEETVDESGFPDILFNFKGLEKLHDIEDRSFVDVLAVVVKDFGCESVTKRDSGTQVRKRDLLLTDSTKKTVLFTVQSSDSEIAKILTLVMVDPKYQPAVELAKWFDEDEKKMK